MKAITTARSSWRLRRPVIRSMMSRSGRSPGISGWRRQSQIVSRRARLHQNPGSLTMRSSPGGFRRPRYLFGNENRGGRLDARFLRVAAPVNRDCDAPARVDVQKGLANGDVHERFDKGQRDRLFVELERNLIADDVPEFFKLLAGNVGDERAEGIIEADDVATDALVIFGSGFRSKADEFRN